MTKLRDGILDLMIGLFTLTAINGLGGIYDNNLLDDDEYKSRQKAGVAYLYIIFAGMQYPSLTL